MAARVAAQLNQEPDVHVETVKGGLGEFTVIIDGHAAITTNRFWYPNPIKLVNKLRALLAN